LPVAIACTDEVGIFSGSAVIDYKNTSGFGSKENPAMVAIYTEHRNNKSKQSQCLAYSLDQGRTFTKYESNPVLDLGTNDFRDPKVQWIDNQWLMTVARPDLHQISFFASTDLKEWNHLSDFGPAAEIGGCWECPDLFKIEDKWVLLVSLNPGGYQVGSGTQYFVGHWNGKEFISGDVQTRWLDYGRDNYAGITFNDAPDNRRIFVGWMSNWEYADKAPTDPWRSAMTLPRELSLDGNALVQKIIEIQDLPKVSFSTTGGSIRISESSERYIEIGLRNGKIFVDATHAWCDIDVPLVQEISTSKNEIDFQVYVDRGSVEVFADGGKVAITNLVFVDSTLESVSTKGAVSHLEASNLRLEKEST
jgi:fructan beta-fructosidase